MKRRDITVIIVSVVVLIIVGALLYRYLAPPSSDSTIKVEVPAQVNPDFNNEELNTLKSDKIKFYDKNINPTSFIKTDTIAKDSELKTSKVRA
jgi:hypothetical protein